MKIYEWFDLACLGCCVCVPHQIPLNSSWMYNLLPSKLLLAIPKHLWALTQFADAVGMITRRVLYTALLSPPIHTPEKHPPHTMLIISSDINQKQNFMNKIWFHSSYFAFKWYVFRLLKWRRYYLYWLRRLFPPHCILILTHCMRYGRDNAADTDKTHGRTSHHTAVLRMWWNTSIWYQGNNTIRR